MADTPENPPSPTPPDPKSSPWAYSGLPEGGFYTPPAPIPAKPLPANPLRPLPGEPGSMPLPGEPGSVPVTQPVAPAPAPSPAPNPAPEAPRAAAKKPKEEEDASLAGIIDTIEAIIIALIVALTFRAFIVEAFVIPTGSMGPTLLGAHFRVICPKCGYEYVMDARLEFQLKTEKGVTFMPGRGEDLAELHSNRGVPMEQAPICQNCRYQMVARDLPQYLGNPRLLDLRQGAPRNIDLVWANNGDRILVLKYLYSVMEPKRWDVIVFKEPGRAENNYIKRLIGLPGDTLQIVNGDIYIQPRGSTDPKERQIARKPDELQSALWQLVYNNEYYPIDEGKPRPALQGWGSPVWANPVWTNPWQPEPAHKAQWKSGPVMAYGGNGASTLQFHQLPPGAPESYPPYGLNTLGYNSDLYVDDMIYGGGEFAPRSLVGDLRLETHWTPHDAAGAGGRTITLTLGRPNNCFRVTWGPQGMQMDRFHPELKNDPLKAWSKVEAQTIALPGVGAGGAAMPAPEAGKSYRLALNNVDHAVAFFVDGKKIMWFQEDWDAADAIKDLQAYPADWSNSPSPRPDGWERQKGEVNTMIQIDVGGACELSHLKLFRDLYYAQVTKSHQDHTGWVGTGTQDNPITLGDDEFFAMGDNSRRSSDGRLWKEVHPSLGDLGVRPGIVPRRYLLGKAFFVYWPAGFTPVDPKSDIPLLNNLPLVPNTGSTRSIR